jgi:flagellar FliJ protein
MAFRFALATLLRYRESMENREYLLLRNAQQEVAGIRTQIAQLQERRRALISECNSSLTHGLMAAELHSCEMYKQQLESAIEQLKKNLKAAELRRDQQRKTYEVAHQKREVLSTMRDRQLRAYELEEGRRQQRQLDDLFLSRRKIDK